MKPFAIFNPTKILFGSGEIEKAGEEAAKLGKKAIIVTGKNSTKKSGVLDRVVAALKKAGVDSVVYNGITPNPKSKEVEEASALARKEKCDMVIGLGGGSAMDAAKGVAVVACCGGKLWDYIALPNKKAAQIEDALPIMLIPTLAATGSEGNPAAVFTNPDLNQKAAIYNPAKIQPKVSIVDPDTTLTVPPQPTAEGVIDIIMHVLEEYLSGEEDCELQDRITEGIIITCIKNGRILVDDPKNRQARANVSLASTVALQGLPNSGRAGAWVVHPMEHAITAYYDGVAHGSGISALLPPYLRWLGSGKKASRVIQLAYRIFSAPEEAEPAELVEACADGFRDFCGEIGLKTSLKDMGVKENMLEKIADKEIELSGMPIGMDKGILMSIYEDAYKSEL
jgi:alcohol dehydrogenase YqhD (iron-dependent ADH family)